ncbi:MAG TPA: response regulator transcription factor [Thermomicrobiales bacterium]|nr:response regulator transcription factor [Thermomicrobiales bacterium]
MTSRQSPSSALAFTRAISSSGEPIPQVRQQGKVPVIGLVSAYRYQGLRLSTRLEPIPGYSTVAMSARDVIMPRPAIAGEMVPPCNLLIVEPGDLPRATLGELVAVAQQHDLPLIWLGEPPIAQRLATATLPGGMLPPQSTLEQIERTLRAAETGLNVIHPDFAHVVDQTEHDVEDDAPLLDDLPVLSPREQEVLTQVANGLPNKAIARVLGITDHTVKFHISSVLSKLDASSRSEAVAIAARRGLLADSGEP